MKIGPLQTAIDPDALMGKSKVYIRRALNCKNTNDHDQYQLWASLALELLAKSFLAKIHPSLIVKPDHFPSLSAASGINIETDIITIPAKTLFDRLEKLLPEFDEKVKEFCYAISRRRNAELHSGEVPFQDMRLETWEGPYWYTVQILLKMSASNLEEWLGVNTKPPPEILDSFWKATKNIVETKIEQAKEGFSNLSKREHSKSLDNIPEITTDCCREFFDLAEPYICWESECPACPGPAIMAGKQYGEDVLNQEINQEDEFDYTIWDNVIKYYGAEEFHCPICNLHLDRQSEIAVTNMTSEYDEVEDRVSEYQLEYENE